MTTSETAAAMNMSDCLRVEYRGGGCGVSKGARQERRRGVIAPRPVTEKSGRRRAAFQRGEHSNGKCGARRAGVRAACGVSHLWRLRSFFPIAARALRTRHTYDGSAYIMAAYLASARLDA